MSGETAKPKTCVFWDVDDCPIPSGLDPNSIYRNIKSALANEGFDDILEFKAYGDKGTFADGFLLDVGITFVPKVTIHVRQMLFDICEWALVNPKGSNLLLISKCTLEFEDQMFYTVRCLADTGYNVLLALPDKLELPFTARSIWLWTSLSNGGSPIEPKGIKRKSSADTLEPQPDTLEHVLITCVFWDLEDFPYPQGLSPSLAYDNIASALVNKGFSVESVAVNFYAGKLTWPDDMVDNYEGAGFVFDLDDPKDKFSRVGWMLLDIYLWLLINPEPGPGVVYNVMIVSNNISEEPEFAHVLETLKSRIDNLLLVQSKKSEAKSFVTESVDWLCEYLGGGESPAGGKKTKVCPRCGSSIVS